MDPNATLFELIDALYVGDRDVATEKAEALAQWLAKGGYQPTNITKLLDKPVLDMYGVYKK
jgi:5,10-methenyltetrahydromethanopterin hydrogenase